MTFISCVPYSVPGIYKQKMLAVNNFKSSKLKIHIIYHLKRFPQLSFPELILKRHGYKHGKLRKDEQLSLDLLFIIF